MRIRCRLTLDHQRVPKVFKKFLGTVLNGSASPGVWNEDMVGNRAERFRKFFILGSRVISPSRAPFEKCISGRSCVGLTM